MPALAIALALLLTAGVGAANAATKAPSRDALTVKTSLGPIATETDTRDLRGEGKAPKGSRLTVRFYRGTRRLATRHPRLRDGRYASAQAIGRTGTYVVRVTARTRTGERLRVTAKLEYGPKAKAPSAP